MEGDKLEPLIGNELDQQSKKPKSHRHHHHYNQRQLLDQSSPKDDKVDQIEVTDEKLGAAQAQVGRTPRNKGSPHRSQSSPSSLTTHKFGLRPTPSPPRLIIDHQTGDIIESYPEQPVYLRTYQPVDDSEATSLTNQADDSSAFEVSLLQAGPESLSDNYNYFNQDRDSLVDSVYKLSNQGMMSGSSRTPSRSGNIIPPPHSAALTNKVYFAPPLPGGTSLHLNSTNDNQIRASISNHQPSDDDDRRMVASLSGSDQSMFNPAHPLQRIQTGSHNSSFKRALNKLEYGNHPQLISSTGKTDIAFVTSSPTFKSGQVPTMNITSTNLIDRPNQPPQHSKLAGRYEVPSIESFKLYNFCFNFRVVLAILISALIIYLLVKPLNLDCFSYRPTYTYISIILASVNLTCITVFSLFWFCSGVTRALYANLSSSAFIVTIYSILVAVNLALAIMFFFINTCNYQKIAHTRPLIAHAVVISNPMDSEEFTSTTNGLRSPEALLGNLKVQGGPDRVAFKKREVNLLGSEKLGHSITHMDSNIANKLRLRRDMQDDENGYDPPTKLKELRPAVAPTVDKHFDQDYGDSDSSQPATPTISPIEAAWNYLREQAQVTKRNFYLFLISYDLRFIGALHALCAICLQYLAIRIAVVRSYFCTPIHDYI